jgi:hypothetical protein
VLLTVGVTVINTFTGIVADTTSLSSVFRKIPIIGKTFVFQVKNQEKNFSFI